MMKWTEHFQYMLSFETEIKAVIEKDITPRENEEDIENITERKFGKAIDKLKKWQSSGA